MDIDKFGKILGILVAIAGLVTFYFTITTTLKHRDLVLHIDKDVVSAPPALMRWASWGQNNLPRIRAFTGKVRNVPPEVSGAISQAPETGEPIDLYSKADFGSISVTVVNNTDQNIDGATLQISKLNSYQGASGNSDYVDLSSSLREWNDKNTILISAPSGGDPNNKVLNLKLPKLQTRGYVHATVFGLNSGYADADVKGAGAASIQKYYISKSEGSSPRSKIPPWASFGAVGLWFVATLYFALK